MNFEIDIKECIDVLKTGGIILYPTDTIWGIGCDATNKKAVAKIFKLKKRAEQKSMIILLSRVEDIQNYGKQPSAKIKELLTRNEKPLTVIYPEAKNIAENLISSDGTIAIRVVQDLFCKALIESFGKPIVSTSANISGESSPHIFDEISTTIKNGADYIVEHRREDKSISKPSRIILWKTDDEVVVIRE